jgi:hypothetical protein
VIFYQLQSIYQLKGTGKSCRLGSNAAIGSVTTLKTVTKDVRAPSSVSEVSCRQLEQMVDELILSANVDAGRAHLCVLRIMCMASSRAIIRSAAFNARKPCLAFTGRLMAG